MKYSVFVFLLALLLLSGCSDSSLQQLPETPTSSLSTPITTPTENHPTATDNKGTAFSDEANEHQQVIDADFSVSFERVGLYFEDEHGNVIAEMYFDKPVLNGESDAVASINAYFDKECKGFFYGSEDSANFKESHYNDFSGTVDTFRDYGILSKYIDAPLQNTVNSEITYMSRDILSIKLTQFWWAGGVSNTYFFGATFNLETGELIPLDYFITADIETFNEQVLDFFRETFSFGPEEYEQYAHYNYTDYNYYFTGYTYINSGANVCITFNDGSLFRYGYILNYHDEEN